MCRLQVPSIFYTPVFTFFRHEFVSTFPTSYWKIYSEKANFIPCIDLIFQNDPLELLGEKKDISAADIQLVF